MGSFFRGLLPRRRGSAIKIVGFTVLCYLLILFGFKQNPSSNLGELLDRNRIDKLSLETKQIKESYLEIKAELKDLARKHRVLDSDDREEAVFYEDEKKLEDLFGDNESSEPKMLELKKNNNEDELSDVDRFGGVLPPPNIFGIENVGELGVAVKMPANLSSEIKKIYNEGWENHQFNQYLSDLISIHRKLPDYRSDYCRAVESNYSKSLPATSVIFIFHNEAWSTLLRSVHSVLDQSPEHLIEEIILVDDYSDMDHLKQPLENYMKNFPKVKILRAEKREGLIKARIRGALAANGPVLTFLDSHIECTSGWLEPLLDRIAQDPTTVPCPIIEVIDDLTFEYLGNKNPESLQVGVFDWNLQFNWGPMTKSEKERRENPSEPARSPTMAGGLFSIDKAFFEKLGMYDPDFDIWGAENLELSFKTWMCGGTLEIIPCSHVGHIFRKKSPYKWREGVNVVRRNSIRLAEVWMDEYAQYYYMRTGLDLEDFGDITERKELRKNLNCKPFKWYIENICPKNQVPDNLAEGFVRNLKLQNQSCLDAPESKDSLISFSCHFQGGTQFFEFTKNFEIKNNHKCLQYSADESTTLRSVNCNRSNNQRWNFEVETNQLMHKQTHKCLGIDMKSMELVMETCQAGETNQKWEFQYFNKEKMKHLKL